MYVPDSRSSNDDHYLTHMHMHKINADSALKVNVEEFGEVVLFLITCSDSGRRGYTETAVYLIGEHGQSEWHCQRTVSHK